MYQFMVGITTPRGGAMSRRMAVRTSTTKWASRVVVMLQLAAWSAVGVVLLQKGITSLQKTPTELTTNVTQIAGHNNQSLHPPRERDLLVIPIIEPNSRNREIISSKNVADAGDSSGKSPVRLPPELEEPRILESVGSAGVASGEDSLTSKLLLLPKTVSKRTKWEELKNSADSSKNSFSNARESQRLPDKTDDMFNNPAQNSTDKSFVKSRESSTPAPSTKSGVWESRRRLRLSHLSGGGAAAGVAMVAVGAVMLVLGPAIIVLRALDERRQERRFLKSSGRDDPPSYEQATLMDEAPRYSTLNLNSILGPPPPPSPTPTRVYLV